MDIYSFVNSKDIREHLRKMDYQFNSLETAWLIYQCRYISYEEQKVAWTELIHTMPDCEVPKRSNCRGWNSLHIMLQEYMDTYDKIIAEFYNDDPEEKYVYMYSYLYKGDRRWTEEFDTLYGSLEECLKAYKEDVDDLDETYSPGNGFWIAKDLDQYDKYKNSDKKGKKCVGVCLRDGYWSIETKHLCDCLENILDEEDIPAKSISIELKEYSLALVDAEGKLTCKQLGSSKRMYHIRVKELIELIYPLEGYGFRVLDNFRTCD